MNKKKILYFSLIFIGFMGVGRTFDNSVSFMEHIFKPIISEHITVYYGNFITLIVIFYGIKGLIEMRANDKHTFWLPLISTVVLISMFINIWTFSIKAYMGMKNNLDAIYHYGDSYISLRGIDDPEIGIRLTLENCSPIDQEFHVKIYMPESWSKYLDSNEPIYLLKRYTLNGKEKMTIEENVNISSKAIRVKKEFFSSSEEIIWELYTGKGEKRMIKHVY